MSQLQYLNSLKSEIETRLPALLTAASLLPMAEYVIGEPTDELFLSVGCYMGPGDKDSLSDMFNPVVQMQIKGLQDGAIIDYEESLLYYAALYDLLDRNEKKKTGIDPKTIGMVSINRLSCVEFPPDETGTSVYQFFVQYKKDLDDCDS